MSYQSPADQPPYLAFPAPSKHRRTWMVVAASFVAVTAVAGVLIAVLGAGSNRTNTGSAPPTTFTAGATTTTTYQHTPYVPQPADLKLDVQVIEQHCFGTAGCNVTFRLALTYTGDTIYDDEGPYTVVYSLTGTSDPFVGRITLLSQYEFSASEELVQTPPGATLTTTVTQVF